MIVLWNDCLGWVGITNSVIPDQIAPWEARLLELTLFDQAYPELQIASVQAQIMGTFSPNMDKVENKDVMDTDVFLLVWYIFTSNMLYHGAFHQFRTSRHLIFDMICEYTKSMRFSNLNQTARLHINLYFS